MKNFLCGILLCFMVLYAGTAHAVTLTSGQSTTGSVPLVGYDTQTFSGTTGQGVKLSATATEANYFGITVQVYKPDGTYYTQSTNGIQINSLPATGTYTLRLSTQSAIYAGGYRVDYVAGGEGVSSGSLTSGGSTSGSLVDNGLKSYTFNGTAGRAMQLNIGDAGYNTYCWFYKPDGTYWGSGTNGITAGTAVPVTGTYTMIVQGANFNDDGAYKTWYVEGNNAVADGAFASGTVLNSSIDMTNQLRSYTFNGTAGEGIQINIGDAAYTAYSYIYKPDGSYWGYGATTGGPWTLPVTGTYTVVVWSPTYSATGPYNLYYLRGADNVSEGWLVTGLARDGDEPQYGIKSYKFSGTSGQAVTISTTATGSYTRYLYVYKPDGSYWYYGSGTYGPYTLPATGVYTVSFQGIGGSSVGAYTITLTSTQPSVPPPPPPYVPCVVCGGDPSVSSVMGSGMGNGTGGGGSGAFFSGGSLYGLNSSPTGNIYGPSGAGDVMNVNTGSEQQVETDYDAGGLVFARIYRSDSSWTSNTVGTLWRHNYARTLNVSGSNADIADGTGAKYYYTLSGSTWVPTDPATRPKLETITGGYKYTLPDGTVEKYNSSKLLTRIEYRGGGAVNLTYNGSNELTGVANENGRSLTLTYSSGRVATVVTPDGTFSYSYTSGKLTTVTKPDTKTRQYHYENGTYTNALTGITDEKGTRWSTYGYDSSGRANSTKFSGNVGEYAVSYTTNGPSAVTNPLSKTFTNYFANMVSPTGRRIVQVNGAATTNTVASSMYYNYDAWGRVIGKTDWQNVWTRYQYDSRSNITKIIEAQGTSKQRVTTITYNNTFNLPDVVTQPGGLTTDYDYDTYGRLTTMTQTDTNTAVTRITTYSYYSNTTDGAGNTILGRLQTVNGPRTDVTDTTDYAYDANFDLTTITNALSQVTTVTLRDSAGRPTRVTDPNGTETRIAYNSNGRVTSVIQAYGTGLAATTSFTYDDNENVTQVTLPNSVAVSYTYDNAQRLTKITDSLSNTLNYTLDNDGNATATVIKNATPTTTYTHTRSFDELSRLLSSIGAASQTAGFAYDKNSNLTTYTDPRTHATGYAYDALQRLSTMTDAISGVTTPSYNTLGTVSSVQDQRSHSTTYTYNAFGDVTGETSPDRGTLSYTVDKAGNVTQRTDANSVVTNFTYDAINRPLTVAYPSDTSLNATLTWDVSTGCGTAYKGRLCTVADATGTTTYVYDVLGRVTSASENRGGGLTLATSYTYDLAGNIATITLPSGRVVTYTRNANGQVTTVAAPVNGSSVNLASSVTYLPFGPMNALTYGNSLTFSATYDTDYYLTNRTVSGSIYNWTYTADANGNITQAGATTYGYDSIDRVNAENPGASTSYTYDATSNRLTKVQGGTTTTTVPSTSNKISAVGGTSYTYDAAGNITAIGTNGYVWSAAGLMKEYKISGVSTATYTYNAWNQRTKKVTGGVTTHYVYGASGLLYGEYNSSGTLVREYVYLNGAPLAQVTAGSPETVIYLHTDHLGTPRFATNTAGSSVWAWNNDAFGVSTPTGSATVNLRMPGQYYDSESSLFYNWNRYYNPAIGRYISSDPAGQAGGLNTFLYAAASPVMWIDPDGLRFRRRPGTFGDQSQINDIIDQAYNMLKCSKAGDWFRQQLQQVGNGLTLEDMFYGNSAEYFYGYYQGPLYGDGHTNWSPVFGPEWGFPGQPDQTMGMTVGSLDWSTKASAKLFIHEAAQALIGQTNYPDKFYAQTVSDSSGMFSDLVGQPGTCGCGGSN